MKTISNLFDRFDQLDTAINRWLVAHSIALLRIGMGLVFLGFGVLKFFPGISPIEDLATRTTHILTLGALSGHPAMNFVAGLECIIGLCFLTGRFLRVGVWLMAAQMIGAMSPLILFPGELFPGPLHAPTLAAQYIIKDIILVAAGMVIASTWTGARIVAQSQSLRNSLSRRLPRVERSFQLPQSGQATLISKTAVQ
jgi:putative oxidoreductase